MSIRRRGNFNAYFRLAVLLRRCRPVRDSRHDGDGRLRGGAVHVAVPVAQDPFRWKEYEKHVLDLINEYPQLRRLVREREALEKRYEKIRAEKLKRRFFVQ